MDKPEIDIELLYGKWYINFSNFPMWTKGSRQFPTLNYEKREGSHEFDIVDRVEFIKGGKPKTIEGYDKYIGNNSFVWKGKGFLSLLRSKWKIIHQEDDWLILAFERTLFTPAGFDLISKTTWPNNKMQDKLLELQLNLKKIDQEK